MATKKKARTATRTAVINTLTKHPNKNVGHALRLASELLAQAKKYDGITGPMHLDVMRAGEMLTTVGTLLMQERAVVLYHRTGATKEEKSSARKVSELERSLATTLAST